ncbi:GNAT superfamily N-acetyltransferase [Undibacterium sp. GrIS 1.8]|uniref:GNAT family N-acetyltransferase n=1 Tax=unclassified Undibacterium TaxID=2630295 RepID=UPI00339A0B5A
MYLDDLIIRSMEERDAASISLLMPELDYEASEQTILRRFEDVFARSCECVFVAELNSQVVGFCHATGVRRIDSDGYGEILTLVVRNEFHRQGIGGHMVRYASDWIYANGFSRVRLGSGVHRVEAHIFYESLGFTKSRPGCVFELRKTM